jgi:hypothetical protein
MTEPPYVFFIMAGLWAAWRWANGARQGWAWALAAGGVFGLAYLTRPEAIGYLSVCLACVLLSTWPDWRGQVGPAALAVAAFLLVMSPYVVYVHRVTGRWTLSGKQGISSEISAAFTHRDPAAHDRAVASLDSTGKEIVWLSPEQYDHGVIDWIRENPARFAHQVRVNIGDTWRSLFQRDLLDPLLAGLALLGFTATAWTRKRIRRELLLVMAFLPLASLWVFFVLSRFLVIAVPLALIWAARGIDVVADRLGAWGHGRASYAFLRGLPLALVVTAFLTQGLGVARSEMLMLPFWRIETAAWLATRVQPAGAAVMMRDSEVALYAGLPAVALPNAEWPGVLDYGRARGAQYLLIEDSAIRKFRPQMSILLDTAHPPSGLVFVAERDEPDRRTLLYRFDDAE